MFDRCESYLTFQKFVFRKIQKTITFSTQTQIQGVSKMFSSPNKLTVDK